MDTNRIKRRQSGVNTVYLIGLDFISQAAFRHSTNVKYGTVRTRRM